MARCTLSEFNQPTQLDVAYIVWISLTDGLWNLLSKPSKPLCLSLLRVNHHLFPPWYTPCNQTTINNFPFSKSPPYLPILSYGFHNSGMQAWPTLKTNVIFSYLNTWHKLINGGIKMNDDP